MFRFHMLIGIITVAIFCNLYRVVQAHGNPFKRCPKPGDMKTMNPFDLGKYSGDWYMIAKLPERFFEEPKWGELSCENTTLSNPDRATTAIDVVNSGYSQLLHRVVAISGNAKVDDKNKYPGKLTLHLDHVPAAPYWVLDTDYDSYALVFSCKEVAMKGRSDMAWFLSRSKTMPTDRLTALKAELASYGVDISNVKMEEQDC